MCEGIGAGMERLQGLGLQVCGANVHGIWFSLYLPTYAFSSRLPPAFISKDAMSPDLSPSPIKACCYPLLVSTTKSCYKPDWGMGRWADVGNGGKGDNPALTGLQLLTSNCQKFRKIHKRQWWLKVVSVRNICSVSVMAWSDVDFWCAGFSICHSL